MCVRLQLHAVHVAYTLHAGELAYSYMHIAQCTCSHTPNTPLLELWQIPAQRTDPTWSKGTLCGDTTHASACGHVTTSECVWNMDMCVCVCMCVACILLHRAVLLLPLPCAFISPLSALCTLTQNHQPAPNSAPAEESEGRYGHPPSAVPLWKQ